MVSSLGGVSKGEFGNLLRLSLRQTAWGGHMIAKRTHHLSRMDRRELLAGLLFISPWIVGLLAFTLYPMAKALYYSFTDYNLLSPPTWVGLDNYRTAFRDDPLFWQSLGNTVFYALLTLLPGTAISIGLAVLLNARVRGQSVFRTIYFMPTVGYLNEFLSALGVQSPPGWLADPSWTKPAFAMMNLWGLGGAVVIYLAALQGVPQHLLEAAEIDGAGATRRFWHVTVPMISPAILFNVVLGLIGTFQLFTQPFVLLGPGGGPLQSALFYAPYIWENAFSFFKMGYASALAWILFMIIFASTLLLMRLSWDRVYYAEGR
jgi:multiple sugar transport system permease protein